MSLFKLVYKNPTSRILNNCTLSSSFKLCRGTRQGCPLSHLIFNLAIEPLAQSTRLDPQIQGYTTKETTNKISLYADDILLYLTHPQMTIPLLLDKINLFRTFAGYWVNCTKIVLMPVHRDDLTFLTNLPFKISSEKFTYLGEEVTRHYDFLFEQNFPPLIEKLRFKILFWDTLPISMISRINAVKMVLTPAVVISLSKYSSIP